MEVAANFLLLCTRNMVIYGHEKFFPAPKGKSYHSYWHCDWLAAQCHVTKKWVTACLHMSVIMNEWILECFPSSSFYQLSYKTKTLTNQDQWWSYLLMHLHPASRLSQADHAQFAFWRRRLVQWLVLTQGRVWWRAFQSVLPSRLCASQWLTCIDLIMIFSIIMTFHILKQPRQ